MRENSVVKSARKGGLTFIEQLHARAEQLCQSVSVPWLTGIDQETRTAYLVRGQCDMWSCPTCGPRNGRRWLARIIHHMNQDKRRNWYFITLTAHENWRGPQASRKNIQQGWKKLYNRMRRHYGVSNYVKVWEPHQDGSWHLHIIIDRKIGKRWWKNHARSCGMGYQIYSVQSKNPGQAAGYAAKYLLKSFELADQYDKGMRRIEVSRAWTKLPDTRDDNLSWVINQQREGQDRSAAQWKRQGFKIVDLRPPGQ